MGYGVHITRKAYWFDEEGPSLSLEDWLGYVSNDREMRADGFAEAETTDGSTIRFDDPGIAVWTSYSGHGQDGNMAWFAHFEDHVTVKNPDAEILAKMHRIATSLGGKVQGDEGEEYAANGSPVQDVVDGSSNVEASKNPWWRFWD